MHHTRSDYFAPKRFFYPLSLLILALWLFPACKEPRRPEAKEIVSKPEDMDQRTSEVISDAMRYAVKNFGKIDDSITLKHADISRYIYDQQEDKAAWVRKEQWLPL